MGAPLAQAAAHAADGPAGDAIGAAAAALAAAGGSGPPHPALPAVGAAIERTQQVTRDDTAVAMGHPDPAATMLGTPRIALWFEIVASGLLPSPTPQVSHVGAGILVHHMAVADIGEEVSVRVRVAAAAGRRVLFSCVATAGERVVALGVHHRVIIERG
jgi:predicted thioesterase